ncbi:MAG: hypothetical protein JSR39_05180 [Verrucomicrobia bacterium]|nr:hypothetical protein [Verrucomicrobiota bacterium]
MATNPLQSLTGHATDLLQNWRNEAVSQAQAANESSTLTCVAAEAGFLLLGVAGTVESVFRSFIFLSVGGIWLCLPQQWADDWKSDYGAPTLENALMTSFYAMGNFVSLIDNFSEDEIKRDNVFHKWFDPIQSFAKPAIDHFADNEWIRT